MTRLPLVLVTLLLAAPVAHAGKTTHRVRRVRISKNRCHLRVGALTVTGQNTLIVGRGTSLREVNQHGASVKRVTAIGNGKFEVTFGRRASTSLLVRMGNIVARHNQPKAAAKTKLSAKETVTLGGGKGAEGRITTIKATIGVLVGADALAADYAKSGWQSGLSFERWSNQRAGKYNPRAVW